MRILLTNDDGIASPALPQLARWAMQLGDVTVVAPLVEQSGRSQAINFHSSFKVKKIDFLEGCDAYAVDSTPADCVRFAITGLHKQYDLMISGINRGYNLGDDIAYSGTIGAIFEAARLNTRAIALSTDIHSFDSALSNLDNIYSFITENKLLEHANLLNINFPTDKINGICVTKQGGMFYTDEFVSCGDDMYMQVGEPLESDSADLSIDISAIRNGYISVTPLTSVKTDMIAYDKINIFKA